jgi:hypothetical protein
MEGSPLRAAAAVVLVVVFAAGGLLLTPACSGTGDGNVNGHTGVCTRDEDCFDGQRCIQGACETVELVGCELTGCGPYEFCDTEDLACKASGEKACTEDGQCGEGFICPPSVGRCMQGCLLNEDCAPEFSCNNALGACVECTFDPDCTDPDRPRCLSDEGRCVGCLEPGHCPDDYYCDLVEASGQRYSCREGCLDGNDCAPGTRCEREGSAAGRCVECTPETVVQDCTEGNRGRCHPDLRRCTQCYDDEQCNVGQLDWCHPGDWVCVRCLEDEHCPLGTVCVAGTSTCEPGCRDSDRCPPVGEGHLLHCDPARGDHGECLECLEDGHCELGYKCDDGVCVEGCDGDHNCPEDRPVCHLVQDRCIECLGDGDCPEHLFCDLAENRCSCLSSWDTCSSSAQCGNPQGWPDVPWWDGTCTGPVWCTTQVKCSDVDDGSWQAISGGPRCTEPCSIPDRRSTCPSGYCCRRVQQADDGALGLKCVADSQCQTTCFNN